MEPELFAGDSALVDHSRCDPRRRGDLRRTAHPGRSAGEAAAASMTTAGGRSQRQRLTGERLTPSGRRRRDYRSAWCGGRTGVVEGEPSAVRRSEEVLSAAARYIRPRCPYMHVRAVWATSVLRAPKRRYSEGFTTRPSARTGIICAAKAREGRICARLPGGPIRA